MRLGLKIFLSIVIGWIVTIVLLKVGFNVEHKLLSAVLLWNVKFFILLAGNGPFLGYDTQGNPMYEGTPVHLFFALIGIVSGFIIYPTILFLILTLIYRIKNKNK